EQRLALDFDVLDSPVRAAARHSYFRLRRRDRHRRRHRPAPHGIPGALYFTNIRSILGVLYHTRRPMQTYDRVARRQATRGGPSLSVGRRRCSTGATYRGMRRLVPGRTECRGLLGPEGFVGAFRRAIILQTSCWKRPEPATPTQSRRGP